MPKEVKFIVPEMNCQEKQELWYHEPEQVGMVHMRSRRGIFLKAAGEGDARYQCVQLHGGDHCCLQRQVAAQLQGDHME